MYWSIIIKKCAGDSLQDFRIWPRMRVNMIWEKKWVGHYSFGKILWQSKLFSGFTIMRLFYPAKKFPRTSSPQSACDLQGRASSELRQSSRVPFSGCRGSLAGGHQRCPSRSTRKVDFQHSCYGAVFRQQPTVAIDVRREDSQLPAAVFSSFAWPWLEMCAQQRSFSLVVHCTLGFLACRDQSLSVHLTADWRGRLRSYGLKYAGGFRRMNAV